MVNNVTCKPSFALRVVGRITNRVTAHVQYWDFNETFRDEKKQSFHLETRINYSLELIFFRKTLCCGSNLEVLSNYLCFHSTWLDLWSSHILLFSGQLNVKCSFSISSLLLRYTVFHFPLLTKLFFYSASVAEIAQNRKRRFLRLEGI